MRDGWRSVTFGDVVDLALDPVAIEPGVEYPVVGVLNKGRGLLVRDAVTSETTKYRKLNRVAPNQLIYSKLKAFEGSMTVAPAVLGPAFASQEFPTFTCRDDVLPGFLRLLTERPELWDDLAAVSKGMGGRRERVAPADVLTLPLLLPTVNDQQRIVDLIDAVDGVLSSTRLARRELSALLDKARSHLPTAAPCQVGDLLVAIESGVSTKPVEGPGPRKKVLTLGAIRPAAFDSAGVKDVGVAPLPARGLVRDGDLLISRSNTPDRVGFVCRARDVPEDTYLPDLAWRLVPDESKVAPSYLEQALSSQPSRAQIMAAASGTSASMQKINRANFSRLTVPVPDLEAQRAYVEPLAAMGESLAALARSEAELLQLRSHMLTVLLSGEHEIPASYDALLEGASA